MNSFPSHIATTVLTDPGRSPLAGGQEDANAEPTLVDAGSRAGSDTRVSFAKVLGDLQEPPEDQTVVAFEVARIKNGNVPPDAALTNQAQPLPDNVAFQSLELVRYESRVPAVDLRGIGYQGELATEPVNSTVTVSQPSLGTPSDRVGALEAEIGTPDVENSALDADLYAPSVDVDQPGVVVSAPEQSAWLGSSELTHKQPISLPAKQSIGLPGIRPSGQPPIESTVEGRPVVAFDRTDAAHSVSATRSDDPAAVDAVSVGIAPVDNVLSDFVPADNAAANFAPADNALAQTYSASATSTTPAPVGPASVRAVPTDSASATTTRVDPTSFGRAPVGPISGGAAAVDPALVQTSPASFARGTPTAVDPASATSPVVTPATSPDLIIATDRRSQEDTVVNAPRTNAQTGNVAGAGVTTNPVDSETANETRVLKSAEGDAAETPQPLVPRATRSVEAVRPDAANLAASTTASAEGISSTGTSSQVNSSEFAVSDAAERIVNRPPAEPAALVRSSQADVANAGSLPPADKAPTSINDYVAEDVVRVPAAEHQVATEQTNSVDQTAASTSQSRRAAQAIPSELNVTAGGIVNDVAFDKVNDVTAPATAGVGDGLDSDVIDPEDPTLRDTRDRAQTTSDEDVSASTAGSFEGDQSPGQNRSGKNEDASPHLTQPTQRNSGEIYSPVSSVIPEAIAYEAQGSVPNDLAGLSSFTQPIAEQAGAVATNSVASRGQVSAFIPDSSPSLQVSEAFKVQLSSFDAEPTQSLSLELNPPELGQLKITVERSAEQLVAQIVASEFNSTELLLQEKDLLLETLTDLGFGDASLDISYGNSGEDQPDADQDAPLRGQERAVKKLIDAQQIVSTKTSGVNFVA